MNGYVIIEIPVDKKREGESNEDTFYRIADTWKGEYLIDFGDYTDEKLGRWIKENMNRAIDTAAEDLIKAEMNRTSNYTILGDDYKVTWNEVTSTRVDTTALKKALPDVVEKFTKTTTSRRFCIA